MVYLIPSWALVWGLILTVNAVNAALSPRESRLHIELMKNAPPGITYHIPKGIRSYTSSSSSKITSRAKSKQAHIQKLKPIRTSRTNSRSAVHILGTHYRSLLSLSREASSDSSYANISSTNAYGTQYATALTWDSSLAPLSFLLDTGSSDTWAINQSNYTCQDLSGRNISQSACGFPLPPPPSSPGQAAPQPLSTFKYGLTDPATHMYLHYADGEIVSGPMGFSDLSIGNITVKKQQVCLADRAYWFGNNVTVGVLGLAFPSLTSAYLGEEIPESPENGGGSPPQGGLMGDTVEYSPFFTSLVEQGQIEPVFSIAIDRNDSTGVLILGEGEPWGVVSGLGGGSRRDPVVEVDMIITNLNNVAKTASEYSFYTIIPDGWYYDQTTNEKKMPYIVDSGTTLCYLPPDLAKQINSAFSPPAVYLWMYGAFFTTCNAIAPPSLAVIIDGFKFWINPRDLIYRDIKDPMTGLCMTAIASGGIGGPYILGDVFMQNVLTIFDVGEAKMRFVPRSRY
ncbi:aspartic peptidase domain-containing protein [Cladorrhinum sp. PSN259]|nr:aspartic peptidase domain-containing protein [Cladorrhinum sp. PSN259]